MARRRMAAGLVVAGLLGLAACSGGDDLETAHDAGATTTAVRDATTTTSVEASTSTTGAGGLDPAAVEAAETISSAFEGTPDEEACMLDAFAENPELFAAVEGEITDDPELLVQLIDVAKDCIDPDTLAAAMTEGMLAESPELSSDQAACFTGIVLDDDELLVQLVVLGSDPLAEPDPEILTALFGAMADCDMASALAPSLQESSPLLTDAEATCAAEEMLSLEPELLAELFGSASDPTAVPSRDLQTAMAQLVLDCGIDPTHL